MRISIYRVVYAKHICDVSKITFRNNIFFRLALVYNRTQKVEEGVKGEKVPVALGPPRETLGECF